MMPRSSAALRVLTQPKLDSPWMTVREAAAYLGVGEDTVRAACAMKGLKHFRVGKFNIRLRREWIDQWAERRAAGTDRE